MDWLDLLAVQGTLKSLHALAQKCGHLLVHTVSDVGRVVLVCLGNEP